MEIEAFLISSTVVSVLAQRLLRRVCENCAQPYEPTAADLRQLGYVSGGLDGAGLRKGRGCSHCRRTGYKGRVCVFELLMLGEEIREAILERPSYEIRRISREKGLVSLLEDAIGKAGQGLTTVEEILANVPRLDRPRPFAQLAGVLEAE
jgi:type IV pilus assembly protein PilB